MTAPIDRRGVVAALAASPAMAKAAGRAPSASDGFSAVRDHDAILNLQYDLGYRLDDARWADAAALFAEDGTLELDGQGVYVGRRRIEQALGLRGPAGGAYGWAWENLQLQPVIDVAPDGRTALARFRVLEFRGHYKADARIGEGVYENAYVKRDGRWLVQRLHLFRTFLAEYAGGWAGAPLPLAGPDPGLPPDRPPTVAYESYPGVFVPPFHRGMR